MTGKGAEEEQKKSEEMAPPSVGIRCGKGRTKVVCLAIDFCYHIVFNRINLDCLRICLNFEVIFQKKGTCTEDDDLLFLVGQRRHQQRTLPSTSSSRLTTTRTR